MKFKIRRAVHRILTSKSIEMLYALLIILFFYVIDTYVLKKRFRINNYFELKLTIDYKSVIKQYYKNLDRILFFEPNDKPEKIAFSKSDLSFDF